MTTMTWNEGESNARPTMQVQPVTFPEFELHSIGAITLAAVLGGPIPAAMLMAQNYRRLGQKDNAVAAALLGIAGMVGLCVLGYFLPDSVSRMVGILGITGARSMAKTYQGAAIESHAEAGGPMASKWKAFGLGMTFLAVLGAIVLYPIFANSNGEKVTFGSKDAVYYSGSATEADAQALGNALQKDGFFQDIGANVLLKKKDGETTVSFVVKDGSWNKPEIISAFQQIGSDVAPAVGGVPIKVQLENQTLGVEKEILVTKIP